MSPTWALAVLIHREYQVDFRKPQAFGRTGSGTIQVLRLPVSTVGSGRIDARRIAAEYFFSPTDLFGEDRIYVDIHRCTAQSSRKAHGALTTESRVAELL